MGTVAPSKKQALADGLVEASALVDQGNFADAIAVLEAVRKRAAAAGDVAALERVLDLANRVYEQAEGKAKRASGSLVLASAEALSAGSQSGAHAPPAPMRPEGIEPFLWLPSSGPRHVVQGGESALAEEKEREERTKTMLWLLVAAILGFVTWLASGAVGAAVSGGLFPCQDEWGTVPGGWPMSNWPPAIAAIIGGVLWVIGGFVARGSDHRRWLMVGFVVVYAAASAVLIVVAPAIWGAAGCVPDTWSP